MITLASGLVNSLIILEFMRNNEEIRHIDIAVGAFTNCREAGLTYKVTGYNKDNKYVPCENFTFCTYEHRNSDEIIINGKPGYINLNGDLPYKEGDKYHFIASFRYNQHYEAANKLAELIKEKTLIKIKA